MKKTTIILASIICGTTLSFSQITIKTPKLSVGKNKEEKKTETNTSKETPAKQTETVKTQTPAKKEEPKYQSTNYPASLANGKNYTIKELDVYRADNEWFSAHMTLQAEDGSKMNESYLTHYKEAGTSYYRYKSHSSFIFPLENGSYLLTNDNTNVANLLSLTKEHISNAPSQEELLKMAKDLVGKIKDEEAMKSIAKNDEEFKKVNQTSKNAALETQFKNALTKSDANLNPEFKNVYKKVLLNSTDWYVVNNALGQPIKKVYNITYIAVDSKNKCFYGYGSVMKEHVGGGKYSDVVKFNGGSQFADGSFKKYISCELVK